MPHEESTSRERRLVIPIGVPEGFAHAVATVLLLGIAGRDLWDHIYQYHPDVALAWIEAILRSNESWGLVHSDIEWWECQLKGH